MLDKMQKAGVERLKAAAIIRDGEVQERGFKSHYELRQALGDALPQTSNLMDTEGFITTTGRFVDRDEAKEVALACGQIGRMWKGSARKLLSSDIDW